MAQEKENIKILETMGLAAPGSGIQIVPRATMHLSEEELIKGKKEDNEIKLNGYVKIYNNCARELLNFQSAIKKNHAPAKDKLDPTNTGLLQHAKDIQLAFEYKSLEKINALHAIKPSLQMIASAPQRGFHEDKGGWSGITEFFKTKDIGVCAYGVMNVHAANSAAQLAQEDVQYLINDKDFFSGIKTRLKTAQIRAALDANSELIKFYWELGNDLIEKQKTQKWGTHFLEQSLHDMQQSFPEMQGFSVRNLQRMKKF